MNLRELRRLREKYGTEELARRLGISKHSLRRNFSTGVWSQKLQDRAAEVLEREAIETEPAASAQVVPGYGPAKKERVLRDLRGMLSDSVLEWNITRKTIFGLEHHKMPIPAELIARELKTREHMQKLQNAERYVRPSETIEERIEKIKDVYREASKIARDFGMDPRTIYTLFFSPPHMGVAAQ